ncbi:MAG: DUF2202 domain-containing protein [Imperialibacter sp.]|uniref:DUF2202 domain-containing protein n=1 Tax=Imperialibacter sp. TaxID=2038411 RepID=UPI0032EC640C
MKGNSKSHTYEKLMILVAILAAMASCQNSNDGADEVIVAPLTEQETADILFLREEEKLARDVYLFSYDMYGQIIFDNISNSEQTHMNSVYTLIAKYNLSDPTEGKQQGEFQNQVLQNLYDSLASQSSVSLLEALRVGAGIEDLDINDLDGNISNTIKADLLQVYSSLQCGSRNHLRNFVQQVENLGGMYEPEFISLDDYNNIVTSQNERCGLVY